MAKKSVAAPATPAEESSKKKKEPRLRVNAKLEYFWDMAELSWHYCDQYNERIVLIAPYLTREYIEQQVAFITKTRELPNNVVRKAGNTKSLHVVQSMREVLMAKARVLDAALRKFKQHDHAAYQVEYKESGLYSFRQATETNYPAVSTFITTANKYLASYGPQLVGAGVMATSFPQEFKDAGVAYNATKTSLSTTRETAKGGTDKVISEVDKIKMEIRTMQDFRKATFHDEPELYKLFTEEYLKEAVRSRHPASLNGRTTWPKEPGMDQAKPVAGLKVEQERPLRNQATRCWGAPGAHICPQRGRQWHPACGTAREAEAGR